MTILTNWEDFVVIVFRVWVWGYTRAKAFLSIWLIIRVDSVDFFMKLPFRSPHTICRVLGVLLICSIYEESFSKVSAFVALGWMYIQITKYVLPQVLISKLIACRLFVSTDAILFLVAFLLLFDALISTKFCRAKQLLSKLFLTKFQWGRLPLAQPRFD